MGGGATGGCDVTKHGGITSWRADLFFAAPDFCLFLPLLGL